MPCYVFCSYTLYISPPPPFNVVCCYTTVNSKKTIVYPNFVTIFKFVFIHKSPLMTKPMCTYDTAVVCCVLGSYTLRLNNDKSDVYIPPLSPLPYVLCVPTSVYPITVTILQNLCIIVYLYVYFRCHVMLQLCFSTSANLTTRPMCIPLLSPYCVWCSYTRVSHAWHWKFVNF